MRTLSFGPIFLLCAVVVRAQFVELSSKLYQVSGAEHTLARVARVDADGNIYVAGQLGSDYYHYKLFLSKFAADQTELWSRTVTNSSAVATALCFDKAGRIYVAANSDAELFSCIMAFNEAGEILSETNLANTTISGLEFDTANNMWIAGAFWSNPDPDITSFFVQKYSESGALLWNYEEPRVRTSVSYSGALAQSTNDQFYLARIQDGRLLVKGFDSAGNVTATFQYVGPYLSPGPPHAVTDAAGNLYVVSESLASVLIKYSGSEQLWATRIAGFNFGSPFVEDDEIIMGVSEISAIDSLGQLRRLGTVPEPLLLPVYYFPVARLNTPAGGFLLVENHYIDADSSGTNRAFISLRTLAPPAERTHETSVSVSPRSQTVQSGDALTLRAEVEGGVAQSYQWFRDQPIPRIEGATNATLQLSDLNAGMAGAYWVEVQTSNGPISSTEVVVDVLVPVMDQLGNLGETILLQGGPAVAPPQHLQWFHDGESIPGATNAVLGLTNLTATMAGDYRLEGVDAWGEDFSQDAQVEVSRRVREQSKRFFPLGFRGMALDPSNNVIVSAWNPISEVRAILVRPNGQYISQDLGGGVSGGISSDEMGNIFVNVSPQYSSTVYSYKFASEFASLLWERTNNFYAYRAYLTEFARASHGTVYGSVWGLRSSAAGPRFYNVIGVNETVSTNLDSGGGYFSEESVGGLEVGRSNDVFVLSRSFIGGNFEGDKLVRGSISDGTSWTRYTKTNGYFNALALDAVGNAVLAGSAYSGKAMLMKIAANGTVAWTRTYGGGISPVAMAVDSAGSIVVTGPGGTMKLNSTGEMLWLTRVQGVHLALDPVGGIFIGGGAYLGSPTVAALSKDGMRLWGTEFRSLEAAHRNLRGLRSGKSDEVCAAFTVENDAASGFSVVRYSTEGGSQAPASRFLPPVMTISTNALASLSLPFALPGETYRWFFNGIAISNATNSTLTFGESFPVQEGGYSVEISSAFGSILTPETWAVQPSRLEPEESGSAWRFYADGRYRYEVQVSSNLVHWHVEQTIESTNTMIRFAPNSSTSAAQFYRLNMLR